MTRHFNPIGSIGEFFAPNRIIFGSGATKQLGDIARFLGAERILIITDPGVVKAGLVNDIQAALVAEGLNAEVFDGVVLEPPARVVDECSAFSASSDGPDDEQDLDGQSEHANADRQAEQQAVDDPADQQVGEVLGQGLSHVCCGSSDCGQHIVNPFGQRFTGQRVILDDVLVPERLGP